MNAGGSNIGRKSRGFPVAGLQSTLECKERRIASNTTVYSLMHAGMLTLLSTSGQAGDIEIGAGR